MSASWKSKLYHLVLWIVALVYFFPVLWIILSAFKTKNELLATPPKWILSPTLANFANLFARETFWPTLVNSLLISFLSVSIAIVFSFLAAYSLSRFKPVGTDFIMFLILWIRMVPAAAVLPFCPTPLVRLPCGSTSTSRTRWSTSASEAARLIVVVVLPTPPFWLATAM